jgi:hypothetical protein
MRTLHLISGQKVTLYDEEIELQATLEFRYIDLFQRKAWVAVPIVEMGAG